MDFQGLQQGVSNVVSTFLEWIPIIVGTILILVAGWILAGILNSLTRKILKKAGLDKQLDRNKFGERVNEALKGTSRFLGKVVYWIILLGTLGVAANYLDLNAVTNLVNNIYAYIPHVLEALAIFVLAVIATAFASGVIQRTLGGTPTGKIVGSVAPVIILSIAGFMVLNALELAPEIVNITYTALIGALALGMALAFGLGGRDVAARLLEQAYEKGQKNVAQAQTDAKKGSRPERGKRSRRQ